MLRLLSPLLLQADCCVSKSTTCYLVRASTWRSSTFPRRYPSQAPHRLLSTEQDEDSKQSSGSNSPSTTSQSAHPTHHFVAGFALYAKRPSRPFPPPFLSQPSSSFSDPLSTHDRALDKRKKEQRYQGEWIRGITNGDDAVYAGDYLVVANDGVGAWAQKERGHAALWSRLIIHFWALEAEREQYNAISGSTDNEAPDPKAQLQRAFEYTKDATAPPNEWFGTTTASGASLHSPLSSSADAATKAPQVFVTQLGDSQILVIRPNTEETLFKTTEQWHWFDCPRQLGTNSPDTPDGNAVVDTVDVQAGDVVLAMSDGVTDNLWSHEIVSNVAASMKDSQLLPAKDEDGSSTGTTQDSSSEGEQVELDRLEKGMQFVAAELVNAARVIAEDSFAESPFMERAVEEGLAIEGGKLDDISVVAALIRKRPG